MSDQAYDAIHALYELRDSGWRNRLDGMQLQVDRLTCESEELSDENIRLRAENRRLQVQNDVLAEQAQAGEDRRRDAAKVPTLERKAWNLERRLKLATAQITRLERELRQARRITEQLRSLQGMFGGSASMDLGAALPEGVTVKDLVRLCHPDVHAKAGDKQRNRAHEVTKWLLSKT